MLSRRRILAGRILVVDDDPAAAAELQSRLRQLHLDVIGIEQTGTAALAAARRARPDLVVMNSSLSGAIDGITAATEIQRALDIPVVLLTARTDAGAIARAKACSPSACLVRPFRAGDLALGIEMALHRHALDRQLRQRESQHMAARRVAEEAMSRAEDQLREGQRMQAIGHLAGGVAHDFNNLLTVINGYADGLLEMGGWEPRVAKMLTGIHQAGLRSADLTSRLLAFSRKQPPAAHALDPNALVTGIVEMLRRLIGPDITLVTRLTPGIGRVDVAPAQFEQVVMNLVLNARDAMPDGGRIVIETAVVTFSEPAANAGTIPAGRYLVMSVTDMGVGMPPDVQKRIFEPLFTTKAPGKGTGLGLATVDDVVRKAKGRILVFSAVDKGTVFKVYLPAAELAGEEHVTAAVAPADVCGQETVLLVEDDPDVREFAGAAISQHGFKVITASTGLEGLAICDANPGLIHVLVTDLVMPGMGGQELATKVRAQARAIRVLYVSGYPEDALGQGRCTCSAEAFLQKPFTSLELGRAIRDLLDS